MTNVQGLTSVVDVSISAWIQYSSEKSLDKEVNKMCVLTAGMFCSL